MNTIVAIPLDVGLAESIGKKGSENSITFYNRKNNESVIVALAPSNMEEKFYAVPEILVLADQILISTRSIDKLFGEVLVAATLTGKRLLLTDDNDVSKMLGALNFSDYSVVGRSDALAALSSRGVRQQAGETRICVDKAFNVKGVGTVALGVVTCGTARVHDSLRTSTGKTVLVRSMQSQDVDITEAGAGTRVGLALKGLDEKDVEKGEILSTVQAKRSAKLSLKVRMNPFVKEPLEAGKPCAIAMGFTYANGFVESVTGDAAVLALDKEVALCENEPALLVRSVAPRVFASAVANPA